MRKPSLKDIASITGVSVATVSLVLNGKSKSMRISEAITRKILQVAQKEGYTPNQVAIRLRTGKSKLIGLLVDSISGSFFGTLSGIVEKTLRQNGYHVIYAATENDPRRSTELLTMFNEQQVDGYMVMPHAGMNDAIRYLAERQQPVVLLDSYFSDISVPFVMVDGTLGIRKAMQLLAGRGYEKIVYITSNLPHMQLDYRLQGFQAGLKEAGKAFKKKLVHTVDAFAAREEQISGLEQFLLQQNGVQVVVFGANYLGLLGIEVIQRLGWEMPHDIAMVSFDDHEVFRLYPKGITVIEQPVEEIALQASRLLLRELEKRKTPRKNKFILPPKIIVRGSI